RIDSIEKERSRIKKEKDRVQKEMDAMPSILILRQIVPFLTKVVQDEAESSILRYKAGHALQTIEYLSEEKTQLVAPELVDELEKKATKEAEVEEKELNEKAKKEWEKEWLNQQWQRWHFGGGPVLNDYKGMGGGGAAWGGYRWERWDFRVA